MKLSPRHEQDKEVSAVVLTDQHKDKHKHMTGEAEQSAG